jgi:hypothetical protein
MKKTLYWMLGILLMAGCTTPPGVPPERDQSPAFFLASTSSRISPDQISKIKTFVAMNLAVQLQDFPVQTKLGDLEQLADQLADQVPDRALALIVLVDPSEGPASHSSYRYEDRLALIHVPVVTEGAEGDQGYYRVERLVMRALAFMTGFAHSPDPFSVMAPYQTLEELDRRGRNFSPPDSFKFQKRAREKGVSMLESSAFFMAPKDN